MTRPKPEDRLYMRNWRKRWRDAAHAVLGSVCVRCGFADPRALQIDHVKGGGRQERRELGRNSGTYYRRVIAAADTGKYQLLCSNCNWIKRTENGEYK